MKYCLKFYWSSTSFLADKKAVLSLCSHRTQISNMPSSYFWLKNWGMHISGCYICTWILFLLDLIDIFSPFTIYQVSSFETVPISAQQRQTSLFPQMLNNCDKKDFVRWKDCMRRDFTVNRYLLKFVNFHTKRVYWLQNFIC